MIYIGYQGIGKSTICKYNIKGIDLESSNFKYENDNHEIVRDEKWYKAYVNIAKDLSNQGYSVFISSHKEVRTELKNYADCIAIVPDLSIKDEWVEKLKERYLLEEESGGVNATKHKLAYLNALNLYEKNIKDIMNDIEKVIIIPSIDYTLESLINKYIAENTDKKEWKKNFISTLAYYKYIEEL